MSRVNFAVPDFCSLIPNVPELVANFLATLHWKRHNVSGISENYQSDFREPVCGLPLDCRPSTKWLGAASIVPEAALPSSSLPIPAPGALPKDTE